MNKQKRAGIVLLLMVVITAVLLSNVWSTTNAIGEQQSDERLVMKEGQLELMVDDTDVAVTAALNLAQTFDAYVLSQRVWDGEDRRWRYATITFGMDVDEFESFATALKALGTTLDETAVGRDTTTEYGDKESHLASLYETQDRMRGFLAQAENITETLQIHFELIKIEDEIGEVQGRANYLENRATEASLTLNLVPYVPTPTPTPTMTPIPTHTPTPLPTPDTWTPGDTAKTAGTQLQNTSQSLADFLIYTSIACMPWLLLAALFGWILWRVYKRFAPQRSLLKRVGRKKTAVDEEE